MVFPIRPEHTLPPKTDPFGQSQSGHVLLCHEHLKAADVERRHAPIGEQTECFGGDTPATGPWYDSASELAGVVFAHHHHDFAEVRIAPIFGDHEVQQLAVRAVLLEELRDSGSIAGRQRRNRERGRRIPGELPGRVEVTYSKWTEKELRTTQWGIRIRKSERDASMVCRTPSREPVPRRKCELNGGGLD